MTNALSTIERCPHDASHNFVIISNKLARDETISFACRGFLLYLLSMKDGWKIQVKQICKHSKLFLGEDGVRSLLKEAMEAGYIKRVETIVKGLKRYSYIISEEPKFKKSLPFPAQPDMGEPDAVDPDSKVISSEGISYEESLSLENHPPQTPPKKPEIPKRDDDDFLFLEDTVLSPRNRETLRSRYSPEQVKRALKISESIKVKTTLMRLLVHILENPDKYEESELLTPQQALALRHNELIRHSNSKLADINENIIRNFETMYIMWGNERHSQATQISLKNPLDEVKKDIKLSEYLLNLAERDKDK